MEITRARIKTLLEAAMDLRAPLDASVEQNERFALHRLARLFKELGDTPQIVPHQLVLMSRGRVHVAENFLVIQSPLHGLVGPAAEDNWGSIAANQARRHKLALEGLYHEPRPQMPMDTFWYWHETHEALLSPRWQALINGWELEDTSPPRPRNTRASVRL